MIVSRYGLHWAGDIPFLHQNDGSTNLISADLRSPYIVLVKPKIRCPHAFDLTNLAPEPGWLKDPLAQALLPTPRVGPVRLIHDPDGKLTPTIQQLMRLSSPTDSLMTPIWWKRPNQIARRYQVSNLSPLIWASADIKHTLMAAQHIQLAMAHSRRVLIICRDKLPLFENIEWISTELVDLDREPLEAIGSGLVKALMNDTPQTPSG